MSYPETASELPARSPSSPTPSLVLGIIAWAPLISFFAHTTSAERNSGYSMWVAFAAVFALGIGAVFALIGSIICNVRARRSFHSKPGLWSVAFLLNYGFFLFVIPWIIIGHYRGIAAGHQLP
jgi:hypothetical protein